MALALPKPRTAASPLWDVPLVSKPAFDWDPSEHLWDRRVKSLLNMTNKDTVLYLETGNWKLDIGDVLLVESDLEESERLLVVWPGVAPKSVVVSRGFDGSPTHPIKTGQVLTILGNLVPVPTVGTPVSGPPLPQTSGPEETLRLHRESIRRSGEIILRG